MKNKMGKSQSKPPQRVVVDPNDGRNLKKWTTCRFKLGVKFGKDADGGVEAGLGCGYEKRIDRVFGILENVEENNNNKIKE